MAPCAGRPGAAALRNGIRSAGARATGDALVAAGEVVHVEVDLLPPAEHGIAADAIGGCRGCLGHRRIAAAGRARVHCWFRKRVELGAGCAAEMQL